MPVAEETPRHALWRHPITLAGGAIVVVVAAAAITSFHINRQGSSVPGVTGIARQRASLTTGRVAEEEPSGAVAEVSPSGGSAVKYSPFQDEGTPSAEPSSTIADTDQARVPDVAVPKSVSRADVQNTLDGWAKAMNNNDVALEMSYYSDRLDRYFLARNVTREFVAQDKARFYRNGHYIVAYRVGNVMVDKQSAQEADISLIKHWEISDGLTTRSGETRSRLWLARQGTNGQSQGSKT